MGQTVKFTVKGQVVEFNWDKLTPEVQFMLGAKGAHRFFFEWETPEKKEGDLAISVAAVNTDAGKYYAEHKRRGSGEGRGPRKSYAEKRGDLWFKDAFLLALKSPSLGAKHEAAVKTWKKYGGVMIDEAGKAGLVLKVATEDSVEKKDLADKNLKAKMAIIDAKIKKEGWDQETDNDL